MRLPFGKYKGERITNVPIDYLLWLKENVGLRQELSEAIDARIDMALKEENQYKSKSQPGCVPDWL